MRSSPLRLGSCPSWFIAVRRHGCGGCGVAAAKWPGSAGPFAYVVNAERFIALVNRESFDYTEWRMENLFVGETVDSLMDQADALYGDSYPNRANAAERVQIMWSHRGQTPLVGSKWWGRGTCPLVDGGPVPMLMLQKRTETVCFCGVMLEMRMPCGKSSAAANRRMCPRISRIGTDWRSGLAANRRESQFAITGYAVDATKHK